MRTREKARIWRRFMAGESVINLAWTLPTNPNGYRENERIRDVESVLREGAIGKFDKEKK
jgi:hypothetical protein